MSEELSSRKKQRCFEDWIKGDHILVHLDSRASGVSIPEHLANNPALTLKLSYKFQGSTTHDKDGIETYLRFSGNYSCCRIPWSAIWGLTSESGEQKVWAPDMPEEVVSQLTNSTQQKTETPPNSSSMNPAPKAALSVATQELTTASSFKDQPAESAVNRSRPALTRIK